LYEKGGGTCPEFAGIAAETPTRKSYGNSYVRIQALPAMEPLGLEKRTRHIRFSWIALHLELFQYQNTLVENPSVVEIQKKQRRMLRSCTPHQQKSHGIISFD